MKRSTIFVCFVGLDGSGKSSQAKLLQKHLNDSGIRARYTWSRWEPYLLNPFIKMFKNSHIKMGSAIPSDSKNLLSRKRKFLKNPIVFWLWINIALLDYYIQVRRRVIRYLNNTEIVICDRYLYDFLVDQAVNLGCKERGIERILQYFLVRLFPLPDLLFILDVDPEIGESRKNDGTSVEYLMERRDLYYNLKDLNFATVVDASKSFATVACQIKERTRSFLKEHNITHG